MRVSREESRAGLRGAPVRVCVGVLAWNEEPSIGLTVGSILAQSLFRESERLGVLPELIVVANGCRDATAAVAREAIRQHAAGLEASVAERLRVVEVDEPGFARSWNLLSHDLAAPNSDAIIFANADILIQERRAFERLVEALEHDAHAHVATTRSLRHLDRQWSWNPLHWINRAVTSLGRDRPGLIRGHLFCARGEVMRRTWLPVAFPGAVDGLFKRLVVSSFLTEDDDPSRIVVVPDASYLFEAYTSLSLIFWRRVRLMVGQAAIDAVLERLQARLEAEPSLRRDPAALVALLRAWDESDPTWLTELLRRRLEERGPRGTLPSPWHHVALLRRAGLSWWSVLARAPLLAVAVAFDAVVVPVAARRVRGGRLQGVWRDTSNQLLRQHGPA